MKKNGERKKIKFDFKNTNEIQFSFYVSFSLNRLITNKGKDKKYIFLFC
jgi:hypothetical protein